MDDLTRQLRRKFDFTEFRPGQEEVIRAVLHGRDALAVMPTGQGKSLCYQLPATLLPGLTLVVSPLIALMQDQVASLTQRNIAAAAFHSGLSERERDGVLSALHLQRLKLLYVAPERVQHEGFLRLLRSCLISLLVIDEAHCISQWGHDFRPDYMKLNRLRQEFNNLPCLALTATATPPVQADICDRLPLRDPLRLITGFQRENLALSVRPCLSRQDKSASLQRLVDSCPTGAIVVYCATRRTVEEVAGTLSHSTKSVDYYHAGLSDEERRLLHDKFRRGTIRVLVATNAFGMGIDKSDVRLVVHFDIPGSLEAYYQEAGRAGRDGQPASCVLLFHERDLSTQEYFIDQASRDPGSTSRAERMKALLAEILAYVSTTTCRQLAILRYFSDDKQKAFGPCGLCDRCTATQPGDTRPRANEDEICAKAVLETISWCEDRFGVSRIVEIVRGSRSQMIRAYGAEDCPTYGSCKAQSKTFVTQLVKNMIDAGYLRVEGQDYPTLAVARSGQEVLQGSRSLLLKQAKKRTTEASPTQPLRDRVTPGVIPKAEVADPQLFEKLRRLRAELAEEEGVAPFVIFHDKTLRTIASHKPLTSAALLAIPGIGEVKVERYGRRLLEILSAE